MLKPFDKWLFEGLSFRLITVCAVVCVCSGRFPDVTSKVGKLTGYWKGSCTVSSCITTISHPSMCVVHPQWKGTRNSHTSGDTLRSSALTSLRFLTGKLWLPPNSASTKTTAMLVMRTSPSRSLYTRSSRNTKTSKRKQMLYLLLIKKARFHSYKHYIALHYITLQQSFF